MTAAVPAIPVEAEVRHRRRWRTARRFASNRWAVAGAVVLALVVLTAIFAPALSPYDPNVQELRARLQPPSGAHWLGTDGYGRDQLSRLIFGARSSLIAAVVAIVVGAGVGVPLGIVAGFARGWFDVASSKFNDALMSVPALILALAIVGALGPGLVNAMVGVGIILIPRFFRLARAATLDLRQETFIEASAAIGCRTRRTLVAHVVPNVMSPVIVQIAITFGTAINAEAGLSFLGFGARPPATSWGVMLAEAVPNLSAAPYLLYPPGVMIVITVLAVTFVGDGLRTALGRAASTGRRGDAAPKVAV